jgi:iron complex outermembrane receptor protein
LFYAYVDIEIKEGGQGEYPMHGTPHNQVGASINYMADLAAIGALNVNLNAVYRSKTPLDDFDRAGIETDYTVANFRASLDGIAGTGFGAALFVNNLTDEEYRAGGIGLVREVGFYGDVYGLPRMFGGEVSYKF